jgi:hypothetical protein
MTAPIFQAPSQAAFDRVLGEVKVLNAEAARIAHRRSWGMCAADVCYAALCITGWLATTLLCTCGLFVVLFLLVGNGSFVGMCDQIALFARHYVDADAASRSAFDPKLMLIFGVAFGITALFRGSSLVAAFRGGYDGS